MNEESAMSRYKAWRHKNNERLNSMSLRTRRICGLVAFLALMGGCGLIVRLFTKQQIESYNDISAAPPLFIMIYFTTVALTGLFAMLALYPLLHRITQYLANRTHELLKRS